MSWTLYGLPGWGSTLAEGALAWVGAPFDFVAVEGFDQPGPARDRLLAVNPLARIPTLVAPDGEVMTESAAIVLHLADLHPETGLAPPPGDPPNYPFSLRILKCSRNGVSIHGALLVPLYPLRSSANLYA